MVPEKSIRRTVSLHDTQEFDDNLGAGPDEDLTLSSFFSVVDGIKRIVKDTSFDHVCSLRMRFSTRR